MDINKFVREVHFFDDYIDIYKEYTIDDIKEIVSQHVEYWEDATPEDFEELLTLTEEYIEKEKLDAVNEELLELVQHVSEILYKYEEFCSLDDIINILKNELARNF